MLRRGLETGSSSSSCAPLSVTVKVIGPDSPFTRLVNVGDVGSGSVKSSPRPRAELGGVSAALEEDADPKRDEMPPFPRNAGLLDSLADLLSIIED